jgi:hypothetical protein
MIAFEKPLCVVSKTALINSAFAAATVAALMAAALVMAGGR